MESEFEEKFMLGNKPRGFGLDLIPAILWRCKSWKGFVSDECFVEYHALSHPFVG
jgi:hypothetical protein